MAATCITHATPTATYGHNSERNWEVDADLPSAASGPGARAFHGEFEQNAIFHLIVQQTPRMRAALCKLGACNVRDVPVKLPRSDL